jgi:hypothetical protein
MIKKHYITCNRNFGRSECMCRLKDTKQSNLSLCILWINKDRALSGSKEGVNV